MCSMRMLSLCPSGSKKSNVLDRLRSVLFDMTATKKGFSSLQSAVSFSTIPTSAYYEDNY